MFVSGDCFSLRQLATEMAPRKVLKDDKNKKVLKDNKSDDKGGSKGGSLMTSLTTKPNVAMNKGDVSAMLGTLGRGTQTPERSAVLAKYKSLDRFDKEKAAILEKFRLDKSCKWWGTYAKESKKEASNEDACLTGFGTMFMVADALKMPYDHPLLTDILQELPQDDKWEMEDPMERIYAKKGLVRYHLEGVKEFTKHTKKDVESETATSSTDAVKSDGLSALGDAVVNIKIENPEYLLFTQEVKVCKSGKQALERLSIKVADLAAQLCHKVQIDGSIQKKVDEFCVMKAKFDAFVDELRNFCVHADFVTVDDKFDGAMKTAGELKTKAGLHETGMKANLKSFGALI